jgi:hypothetical protein
LAQLLQGTIKREKAPIEPRIQTISLVVRSILFTPRRHCHVSDSRPNRNGNKPQRVYAAARCTSRRAIMGDEMRPPG